MDQNWVESFAMPNRPKMPRLCRRTHFPMVFLCRLPLPLRAAARRSRRRDSFDMSSLVVPLLEQATVVPSESQARSLSRNSIPIIHIDKKRLTPTTDFTTLFNRSTDIRIVQKQDNIARGVISVESLCLRLGMRTVTRALHAQPERCVKDTTRPFTHRLIRHFDCRRGWSRNWTMRLQRGGLTVLILTWAPASQHCCCPDFLRTVLSSTHVQCAARRRAFSSSVFLISPSTRIRHSSVWPCARPPLTDALQPGQQSDVPCAMKSLCLRYSLLGTGSRFGSFG